MPGGAQLPMAAVAMVTVHPTHRRRGVLRSMMAAQLDDVAQRGEPLAGLTASEASIYERFGYGTAHVHDELGARAHSHAPARSTRRRPTDGRVRVVDAAAAESAAHAVYSRVARRAWASCHGPEAWWPKLFAPGAQWPAVLHRGARRRRRHPRRVRPLHDRRALARRRRRTARCRVMEIQGVDADAEAAMWSFLFGIDLVGTITASERPVDDPLRWRLPDPRRMRVRELRDHLWVRVLDVAAALSARTYGADDALVLELVDEFRPGTTAAGSSTAAPTAPRARAPTAPPTSRCRPPTSARSTSVACRCRRSPPPAACASSRPAPSRAATARSSHTRPRGAPRTSDARRLSCGSRINWLSLRIHRTIRRRPGRVA